MIFTGTLDNTGPLTIDQKAVALIRSCAEAAGWITRLSTVTGENHEWIGEGPGLSGIEKIYAGVRSYRTIASSNYRLAGAIFTGFVDGRTYAQQPGILDSYSATGGNPNISLDPLLTRYYIFVNAQRITAVFVGSTNNAYVFHAGKFYQFAFPTEYPYPVVLLASAENSGPFRSNGSYMFKPGLLGVGGSSVSMVPYNFLSTIYPLIETDSKFSIFPITLYSTTVATGGSDVYGTLDGVSGITGYNLVPRSVIQIGGTPVDQSGMSDIAACNAIVAAGGDAYIVFFHGSNRGANDAFCVKWE